MLEAAKIVAFTAEAVARIAAAEMMSNPAPPNTASPASASTWPASCSIFAIGTSATTRALITRYTTPTIAKALNMARGNCLEGWSISPDVLVTTPNPW